MITGLGSDIVEIKRIRKAIKRFGDKFISRNYSENEIKQAEIRFGDKNKRGKTAYFAKRFAAKEAFGKAIGTGIGASACFNEIGIVNDEAGRPYLELSGKAKETLAGITPKGKKAKCHISLSDSKKMAFATVIITAE